MRLIFGLVLIAGLGLAGGAVYMAKNYIGQYQNALAQERAERAKMVKTVQIFVADRAVAYGDTMSVEDVRSVAWPENAIPEGAFTADNILFEEGETRPRFAIRAMEKDEAILAMKVTAPGEEAGLTSRLGPDMNAFAIKVDATTGVSGFLRPGSWVDVYWTGRLDADLGQGRGEVTRLIQSGVEVIAIDQNTSQDVASAVVARTVTVAARQEQVLALTQGQATGRLSLSLVGSANSTNDDRVAEVEIDQRRLLGIKEQAAEEKVVAKKVCYQKERKGTEIVTTEIVIECPN